jgi:two-component system sensor histidine kinase DesK
MPPVPDGWSAVARARLTSRPARRWYPGGIFGGLYVFVAVYFVWAGGGSIGGRVGATVLLAAIPAVYLVLPPLAWGAARLRRHLALLAFAALVCALFPFVGAYAVWLFIYIACGAAAVFELHRDAWLWIGATVTAQLIVLDAARLLTANWFLVALTVSIAAVLRGIAQLSRVNAELRSTQDEVARLAVAEERARFSRDLHDVLGHSLTVVTVKAELAARLVDRDAARARAEIADIERLSRSALADLRASIAGYREMSLDTELAAAREALAAAEIEAVVPVSGDVVAPRLRELFAWSVREAVTNVIRHARATRCEIALTADTLRVRDDGSGTKALASGRADAPAGTVPGHGLAGLVERARGAGASLRVEAAEPHGTVVTVKAVTR